MQKRWNKKQVVSVVAVAVITVIALIGLLQAPAKSSDKSAEELEKELQANEALLQQQQAEEKHDFVTFVGDSVLLGAAPDLMEQMPDSIIDAKESRQARDGIEVLKELEESNKLGDTVVIELGTNSYFTKETGQEMIDYLGKDRKIYWICVYGKYLQDQDRTNEVIRGLAEQNDNLEVIPWDETAQQNPDWFYEDGIHLNGAGREGFATMVRESMGLPLPDENSTDVEFTLPQDASGQETATDI